MLTRSHGVLDQAALGLRVHSGWAALVALAGPAGAPCALTRRRIELSASTPRQPFHAAAGRPFAIAAALIRRSADEARTLAERALRATLDDVTRMGHEPVTSGLLVTAGRSLPDLRSVLASHALIHAAEGELFRDALRQAARSCRLQLLEVRERELEERAVDALQHSPNELRNCLAHWGKTLGAPWTQDEKRAALVAWLALATSKRASPRDRI